MKCGLGLIPYITVYFDLYRQVHMEEVKGNRQRWVAKQEEELPLSFLSTDKNGGINFQLCMLNRHILIKMKKRNLNSKSCEILHYAFLGSMTRKGWKLWSTTGSVTQALLSSVTPVHKTHFEDSLASLLGLCPQLPPVPQLSSTKLFQLCFGRVEGEKTDSAVETMPTFMHYLLYQSYNLW